METDERYMRRALQLAELGRGSVSPNPMVGAVIVADGRIIGEGFHRRFGEAHAEVNAVRSVRPEDESLLSSSTIYVTLEPCSHYGKTPPCSKLLIDKKIPRVVVGSADPFKEVSGRGIRMLCEAGCEVVTGVLEQECRQLNAHFMTAHTHRRPYILLKWAESRNRMVDRKRDESEPPTVISTAVTSALVHKMRSEYDAIMVGSHTAILDKPSLTVRKWCGRNPLRVLLDRQGITAGKKLALLTDGNPTLVFTCQEPWTLSPDVEFVKVPDVGADPLAFVCEKLYERNVTSLMVEGGTRLIAKFLENGLWDEVRIERNERLVIPDGVESPEMPRGATLEHRIDGNVVVSVVREP